MADDSPQNERITEAEQAVMEALWVKSPLTANEVADAVAPARGWGLPTVKTLLSRLVERLFGGSAAGLFAHLAEAEALSDKDLNQIEALLRELRGHEVRK